MTNAYATRLSFLRHASSIALLMTFAAFALRLYHLDAQSFWSDEGISVIRARADIPTLIATLPVEHTPLYFVGLHLWMRVAGDGDFAVRYFSLVFSVLLVPLVYKLGLAISSSVGSGVELQRQRWGSRHATIGIIAALLVAINPLQVWYAQEARMYTLVVVLCAAAAWCLMRGITPTPNPSPVRALYERGRGNVLPFALFSAAALYTHFFAALIVAALALWAIFDALQRRANWRPLALSFILIGLLYLPWLPRAISALSFPGWQEAADPLSLPARYWVAYTLGNTTGDEWRWLSLGFLVLLVLGVMTLARRRDTIAWLPIFYVFVPFVLMMLLALRKPGYHERYLIVITPLVFVILAVALNASRFTFITAMLFVVATSALSLNNLYFDSRYAKPDFRAAAQYIDRLSRSGDGLIFDGPDPYKAFYRYFSRQRVVAFDDKEFDAQDPSESNAFLAAQVPWRERWWVVLYFHPPGPTEDWLARYGYQTSSRWFNGIRVLLYATPTQAALREFPPQLVQTQLPLQIVDVRSLPRVEPGDVLPVIVHWKAMGALPADYQVSVRLVALDGKVVKQLDRRPLDGRVPTSQWKVGEPVEDRYGLLVPEEAPVGQYSVQIILYVLGGREVLQARVGNFLVIAGT